MGVHRECGFLGTSCLLRLGVPKSCLRGDLRARAAMQAPQSPPSSPLGACGTWGPPPDVATVRNRHWRLLGLQNDPNGGWAARQSPTWWPTTWPHPVPPHSPTAPPGRGGPWGRGLWHTRSHSAAWLGLAGPRGRLPARNRPIWAPGAPGQLPPEPLCSLVFSCFGYVNLDADSV